MQKVMKKGLAGFIRKTALGAVGPLKEIRKQDNITIRTQTWPRTRPGVPSGTVADIYIYKPSCRRWLRFPKV